VKPIKKRKTSNHRVDDALSLCNVAGLDASVFGGGDIGEMDCLEAMAVAQCASTTNVNTHGEESGRSSLINHFSKSNDSLPPQPPGFHCIPNARIELARHLQTQSLSSFVLESCPGLRMPTFERWLLDTKLEETERFEHIVKEWLEDSRLVHNDAGKTKKKYGRAAKYHQKQFEGNKELDIRYEREKSRYEKENDMLSEVKKSSSLPQQQSRIPNWTQLVYRDPILPHASLETDPSCIRLSEELFVMLPSINNDNSDRERRRKAIDIVRDLCHRTSESCKEIRNLEQRLGKYQKFAWSGDATRDRKSIKAVDKVVVEWHDDDKSVCSLIFVPKRRTSSHRPASQTGGFRESGDGDAANPHTQQNKPKPFVIKINTSHYNKLRAMFDSCYRGLAGTTTTSSKSKEQSTHAFHAILFCLVIRYSSLSGGQLINDWRGGGMQGAVHDAVFDCFSKWFGFGGKKSSPFVGGTECFASPFNSTLSRYYSAFPSPDLDGHFGSYGDFFQMPLTDLGPGWFEINPPFSPFVMTKMAKRIIELMEKQVKNDVDVTCIVIIPTVRSNETKSEQTKARKQLVGDKDGDVLNDDIPGLMSIVNHAAKQSFDMLINSPYCKSHIILPAQKHGFIEGGQHLRNTKYKESQCYTSVIVLRSQEWSDAEAAKMFDKDIRIAFASRHAMEVKKRKSMQK